MKALLVTPSADSPTDNVLRPLWTELRRQGVDAQLCHTDTPPGPIAVWSNFKPNIVHFGHPHMLRGGIPRPTSARLSCNIWAVANDKAYEAMAAIDWSVIIASNAMLVQQLGYVLGMTNVRLVQQVFDYSKYVPLPLPAGPFTIGVFGSTCPTKRFGVVEEACKIAAVAYKPTIYPATQEDYDLDPPRDVYAHVHAMAHSSFLDPSSVVCQEAMLCGRPALTTRNCGMWDVLKDGQGGYFYDGSAKDLAAKIKVLKADYAHQAALAPSLRDRLITVEEAARQYTKAWTECI